MVVADSGFVCLIKSMDRFPCLGHVFLDLVNKSFASDLDRVKFGSGKIRVTQILFGFDSD